MRGGVVVIVMSALLLVPGACAGPGDGARSDPAERGADAALPPSSATTAAGSLRAGEAGPRYGFGQPATDDLIAAWDRDVGPDGAGLPPGEGSVTDGLRIFQAKCAVCHGTTGTEGPFAVLAGRIPDDSFPFATDPTARSTVGSYWPYATTLFDYTRRTMPFDAPGSLTDHEVYALVGAVLFLNDLVGEDAVMDSAAVTNVLMPARDRFVPDDRAGGPEIR